MPNLVILSQTVRALENLAPGVPLFKVTQGRWNRHGSIGYLWFPVSDPQ